VVIGGVMQHIEEAGIHSGDSACVLPPFMLTDAQIEEMREHTRSFALGLGVIGLINVQYAVYGGVVYVLEVNPRASRTVPFVSKATGVPLARIAARLMVGEKLASFGLPEEIPVGGVAVKEAVFPFNKLPRWIRCSARRCAPRARRWASTTRSGWRSPRRRPRRGRTCPRTAG
jgi:carbamoyl-phosphate synthase large subunit